MLASSCSHPKHAVHPRVHCAEQEKQVWKTGSNAEK